MRKKSFLVISLIGAILLISAPPVAAGERTHPLFDIRLGRWFSQGDASWQISFLNLAGTTTESELEYDNIDSDLNLLEMRLYPTDKFSLGLNLGMGNVSGAQSTDTDRTNAVTWSESREDAEGDVAFWGINLYLHLLPIEENLRLYEVEKTSDFWLTLFVGYQHYEDKLRVFNGRQTVSQPPSTTPLGPFSGLDSTYDFEWDYAQVGIEAGLPLVFESRPALHNLEVNASLGVIPIISYEGEGNWNLRSDFRHDPSFRHESSEGWGIDASLALNYSPHRLVGIILGYRYLYLRAEDGTDTTFFSNGAEATVNLDEVRARRHGPFISVSIRY